MTRQETVTIYDFNDEEIKIGSKVVYYDAGPAFSDEFGTNVGTVVGISDFDGDVDDDTMKTRVITPFITVEWIEFKAGEEIPHTEDYMTSEWEYHISQHQRIPEPSDIDPQFVDLSNSADDYRPSQTAALEDELGYPAQMDATGKCEELVVVKEIQPRIIDPKDEQK